MTLHYYVKDWNKKIVSKYHLNGIVDKDYIEIKLPKIRFREDQQKNDEIYNELIEELWWMKFYDRTFFIVKPNLYIGIKNTISDEEKQNIINKYKKEEKTVDVRAKDGSFQSTYINK